MHFPFFKFASNARWESEKPHSFAGFDSHGQDTRPGERDRDTLKSSNERALTPPLLRPCLVTVATIECATLFTKIECKCRARRERAEPAAAGGAGCSAASTLPQPLPQLSLPPPSCCCMCCINCNTNCRACCSLSVYLCVSHRYICRCCWMRNVVVAQAHGTWHEGQHVGLDNILCSQTGRGRSTAQPQPQPSYTYLASLWILIKIKNFVTLMKNFLCTTTLAGAIK